METELLEFTVKTAYKMQLYRSNPLTEEQYLQKKKDFKEQYSEAKNNYLQTNDKKYKLQMDMLKGKFSDCVSPTEYFKCKEAFEQIKSEYCNEIDEKYWNVKDLSEIMYILWEGKAKTVQEAIKLRETN